MERIIELKNSIAEDQAEYVKLKEEILLLQSSQTNESRIRDMEKQIEQEKIQKEREKVSYDQWLKERDEKKLQLERQWRPNFGLNKSPSVLKLAQQKSTQGEVEADPVQQQQQQQLPGTSSSTPSPLLTSLLKSSQANQSPIQPQSNTARSAPTITNLLTGSSSTSSNCPSSLITQSSSTNAQNLINASVNVALSVPNAAINHSASSSVQIPVSQSAPTLITLLDKKATVTGHSSGSQDQTIIEKQALMLPILVPEGGKDGDDPKDEEADILAEFNELISQNIDDDDLEDLNSIIMNPEILEDKLAEDEPMKDVDDLSQATSTDDYDKLKIKQLVEDFAGVPEVEQQPSAATEEQVAEQTTATPALITDSEVINVPSEPETSNPASVEMIAPTESNDSKEESSAPEDKVMIISDESSNTNDEKKEQNAKLEPEEGEESQSVKSSVADDMKDPSEESSSKETRAFQGIQESDDNSASSDKEAKKDAVYRVEDSDEDVAYEDAKEHQDEHSLKTDKDGGGGDAVDKKTQQHEKEDAQDVKPSTSKTSINESEEISRSAGSVDSDDEVLEVKVSRSTGRKKLETVKADLQKTSTRSRDHSENDDNRDSPLVRATRSRRSSASTEHKPSSFNFPKEQDHSMWKARWEDCQREIQKHKDYAHIVDNKLFQEDSYKSVVLCPMNMKIIQKNIESHVSTLPNEVKRDFALMCINVTIGSGKGTKFYETVHQFMKDGLETIDSHMDVADAYKSYRKQIKKKN